MFTLQMFCNICGFVLRLIVLRAEIQKQAVHNRTIARRKSSVYPQP